jgi:hypothetical protein
MAAIDRIKLKGERADKHIRDLYIALNAFYASKPYAGIANKDPQTGESIYRLTRVDDVPLPISTIVGDVLQNLRSALDHLLYALVAKAIAPKLPSKVVMFPIGETPDEYMTLKIKRKIELAGPEAIRRLDAIKPYKGGNDRLWQIHKLNNIDKHRLLLTTASRFAMRRVTLDDRARMALQMPKAFDAGIVDLMRWTNAGGPREPLKVGDVLYTKPSIIKLQKNMQFKLEVAFNEPQIIECEPLLETLYEMLKLVEGIIPRFADLL